MQMPLPKPNQVLLIRTPNCEKSKEMTRGAGNFFTLIWYKEINYCAFDFRKQEKELRKNEKEARKFEEKAAKKQEKEAAKLEKLYRNTISRSTISRSTERVSSRSGSLERRRSGDGETIVLNQSTVHGKFLLAGPV